MSGLKFPAFCLETADLTSHKKKYELSQKNIPILGTKYYLCILMRIYSKGTLRKFWEEYPEARTSLEFWFDTVENTDFQSPNDVISFFRKEDIVGNGRIVFNIAGNKFRLIVKFEYERKFAFVRFIGTHKEYEQIVDIKNI